MVGSHSEDSLLWRLASQINPLWKWLSLPRWTWAPKSACALFSLSPGQSQRDARSHVLRYAFPGTSPGSLARPPCTSLGDACIHMQVSWLPLSQGSVRFNQMLIFPFFPVKLLSCQAPLIEATPDAGSSTSVRQKLEEWPAGQAAGVSAQQSAHADSAQDRASHKGG